MKSARFCGIILYSQIGHCHHSKGGPCRSSVSQSVTRLLPWQPRLKFGSGQSGTRAGFLWVPQFPVPSILPIAPCCHSSLSSGAGTIGHSVVSEIVDLVPPHPKEQKKETLEKLAAPAFQAGRYSQAN
jgi:hypothetical protein